MLRWVQRNKSELLRFGVVGGFSAALYLGAFYVLKPFLPLWAATLPAYGMAMACNYALHRAWTFESDRSHRQAVPRYLQIHVGAILINMLIMDVGVARLGQPVLPTQFVAFVAIAAWSYMLQKMWVFRRNL